MTPEEHRLTPSRKPPKDKPVRKRSQRAQETAATPSPTGGTPAATPTPDPPPSPTPQPGGISGIALITGMVLLLGVAAVGAVAVLRTQSRTPTQPDPFHPRWDSGPPRPDTPPQAHRAPPSPASNVDRTPLLEALLNVRAAGVSDAIGQQIERLLAYSEPSRDDLVQACVRYRDQLHTRYPQLAGHLLNALRASGVREVLADGQPFDGRLHEAVDVVPTDEPWLENTVASTERCGYVDGDHVVRVPRVIVYRLRQA
ncbi:nucleotide exchange factor GrpE [Microbispora sp. H11081]|uniref:nucleotide exchange factor GrpE n=1 Tax=Microbispora sp. H11081 TaxID=2729107 RepID=UPI001475C54F|nr:nucleotide exchange factor GrpE [Microbispora sp. H11081]